MRIYYGVLLTGMMLICMSCKQQPENIRGVPTRAAVESSKVLEEEHNRFLEENHKVFLYQPKDSAVLMKEYFVALYKNTAATDLDEIEINKLQSEHLDHINVLREKGYVKQMGPVASKNEVEGMIIFSVPSRHFADSLAKQDPLVKANFWKVELYSWWTARGE